MASTTYNILKEKLDEYNQSHLIQFWDQLSVDEQEILAQEINSLNLKEVTSFFKKATDSLNDEVQKLDDCMESIPASQYLSYKTTSEEKLEVYHQRGLEEISLGHVGVLLMAGGQGTRLGVTYPKGMFDVGLPSHKTLFQIQAERIQKLEQLAQEATGRTSTIVWYIMTSAPTMKQTKLFLETNNYFGLNRNNVILFEQGVLPCFDLNGRILLDSKNRIALAPDGNGGLYRALRDNGILTDMEKRNVQYLHAHSVDNILIKVADPIFIGHCVLKNVDCAAKVVEKTNPCEAVGVICKVNGQYQVVEYSEITEKTAKLCDETGALTFKAGNICNHYFKRDFLIDFVTKHERELKLHAAKKKIPYVDENGVRHVPTQVNGIKIEKFVFDVFQYADKFLTWEVVREDEFSALKNADSAQKDCPSTARNDLFKLHRKYISQAGGLIVDGDICEISPLLSYAGENLESIVEGKTFKSPVLLSAPEEKVYQSV